MSNHDWTFGGQLNNIVKFVSGTDSSGSDSYAFLKKEPSDDSATLYLTTDHEDFNSYTEYDAVTSGIVGEPSDIAFGKDGELAIGTSTGLYIVAVGENSIPQSYTSAILAQGHPIVALKYGATSDEWAFSTKLTTIGGDYAYVYSFSWPENGVNAALPPVRVNIDVTAGTGYSVIDIAEGNDGWLITTSKMNDSSLIYCTNDWSVIKAEDKIKSVLKNPDSWDVNYNYDLDLWMSGKSDGSTITTSDINEWLESGASLWVGTGRNGHLAYSADGLSWVYAPIPNLVGAGTNMGSELLYGESQDGQSSAWVMANGWNSLEVSIDSDPTDGSGWTNINVSGNNSSRDAAYSSGTRTFVTCGASTNVLRSTDLGASWSVIPLGVNAIADFQTIESNGASTWLTARGGYILRSVDDGLTWSAPGPSLPVTPARIVYCDGTWIALAESFIYRSSDDGASWQQASQFGGHVWRGAVYGSGIIAVGAWGSMWTSWDHGDTWTQLPSAMGESMYSIATDGEKWIAGGNGGKIQVSTDGGSSWSVVATGVFTGTIHPVMTIRSNIT